MTKDELEKATGQELIDARDYCGADGYYAEYLKDVNAEMLKRFECLAELKEKVSFLEDNLRVARKDRENLQLNVAKGLKEFVKDYPATSLKYLANEQYVEENEKLKNKLKEKLKTIADENLSFVAKFDALEKENAELKERIDKVDLNDVILLKIINCIKFHLCKQDEDYDKPIISPKFLSDILDQMAVDGFEMD